MWKQTSDNEFVGFVLATQPHLLRLAFLVSGDWHRAQDIVQTALVKMYARWGSISRDGTLERYARRAVVNAAIDDRRRPWRRERPVPEVPDAANDADVPMSSTVVEALMSLAARQRAVVVLRYIEDLDLAQTAEVLGISQGTVKSQASKGIAALRKQLHVPAASGKGASS